MHLKARMHNLAFVSVTGEHSSPAPVPYSTAPLPPKTCVGMCVKLPSPTQHSVTGTHLFTRSLTSIHATPPHTPSGACSVTHITSNSLLTFHSPTPSPFTSQSPCSWSLSHPTMCGCLCYHAPHPQTFIHTGMWVSLRLLRSNQGLGQMFLLICCCCCCC